MVIKQPSTTWKGTTAQLATRTDSRLSPCLWFPEATPFPGPLHGYWHWPSVPLVASSWTCVVRIGGFLTARPGQYVQVWENGHRGCRP